MDFFINDTTDFILKQGPCSLVHTRTQTHAHNTAQPKVQHNDLLISLSPPQRPRCAPRRLGRGKKNARGDDGKVSSLFSSSPPRAHCLFFFFFFFVSFLFLFFLFSFPFGIPVPEPLPEERDPIHTGDLLDLSSLGGLLLQFK